MKAIRVLVVDDSALVRAILTEGLSMDPEIEVVGASSDPFAARDRILELKPDVLTLDVEMPRMDGVEFLRRLMPQYPIPTIMVSALTEQGVQTTLNALDAGAIDFVTKPKADVANALGQMMAELRAKVKMAARVDVSHWKQETKIVPPPITASKALEHSTDQIIAIGASTGGTEAIRRIVHQLPRNIPGVVIVQHMPAGFTKMYAERLNNECELEIKEAQTGDRIIQGRVLIAPGNYHMTVRRYGGQYLVDCKAGEKVSGHCPSVDKLFHSVAQHVGTNAIGVMLTGMGRDGAQGMLMMRQAGAQTLAQDEQSCVVFGMPEEAYKIGAAQRLVSLDNIPSALMKWVTEQSK